MLEGILTTNVVQGEHLWYVDRFVRRLIKVNIATGKVEEYSDVIDEQDLSVGKGVINGEKLYFFDLVGKRQLVYDTEKHCLEAGQLDINEGGAYFGRICIGDSFYAFPIDGSKGIIKVDLISGKCGKIQIEGAVKKNSVGNIEKFNGRYFFSMAYDQRIMTLDQTTGSIDTFLEIPEGNGLADIMINGDMAYVLAWISPKIYLYNLSEKKCTGEISLPREEDTSFPYMKLYMYRDMLFVIPNNGLDFLVVDMKGCEVNVVYQLEKGITINSVYAVDESTVLMITNQDWEFILFDLDSYSARKVKVKGIPLEGKGIITEGAYKLEDYLNSLLG